MPLWDLSFFMIFMVNIILFKLRGLYIVASGWERLFCLLQKFQKEAKCIRSIQQKKSISGFKETCQEILYTGGFRWQLH